MNRNKGARLKARQRPRKRQQRAKRGATPEKVTAVNTKTERRTKP